LKQKKVDIEKLRIEFSFDFNKNVDKEVINKKNKEFTIIEAMSLIKILSAYLLSRDT